MFLNYTYEIIFSADPHEILILMKCWKKHVCARVQKKSHYAYTFCPNVLQFFGAETLETFKDSSAKLGEHLSQKNLLALPPKTPKFGQKRALGGPKMGQKVCFAQFFKAD